MEPESSKKEQNIDIIMLCRPKVTGNVIFICVVLFILYKLGCCVTFIYHVLTFCDTLLVAQLSLYQWRVNNCTACQQIVQH